ncbi:MAG: pyrroline-5-carboxylate reductase [Clostridia bacterium]|nr:pyrroline-5-carboxylate reductase [Clostridia bacterium]
MSYKLAVLGVGNMAKAVITGIQKSNVDVSAIYIFDKNKDQYKALEQGRCSYIQCESIKDAVVRADCVLLAVKPQNYSEVLEEIKSVQDHNKKLYVSIAAGITVQSISDALGKANVVRVLPNLPMTVGVGVSVICKNPLVNDKDFAFVTSLFSSSGSVMIIDESEMNRIIGVTSSSPAYVFKFIDAICKAAVAQGLSEDGLLDAVCDVFIGAATLLKHSKDTPTELISRVCSKGGTTEQAMNKLQEADIDTIILDAMIACTNRADELGNGK